MQKLNKFNVSWFSKSLNICTKNYLNRRYVRFFKRRKRYFNRRFSRLVLRLTGFTYPNYLKKKYFSKRFFLRKKKKTRVISNIRLKRFLFPPKKYSLSDYRAATLLLRSAKNIKLFSNRTLKQKKSIIFLAPELFKKEQLRSKLLKSRLTGYRFSKFVTLFAKKGNNHSLSLTLLREVNLRRSTIYKTIQKFFFQLRKSRRFNSKFINKKPLKLSKAINNRFRLSFLIRRFLGIFYKIKLFSRENNDSLDLKKKSLLLKFILRRFKFFLTFSSSRSLSTFFKPFYLFFEVRPWKKSGRSVTIPVPIRSKARRSNLFGHWFKNSSLSRSESSFKKKFIGELYDLSLRQGSSINKLSSMSKLIKSNRALIRKSRIKLA